MGGPGTHNPAIASAMVYQLYRTTMYFIFLYLDQVLEPVDWSAQYRESISLGQYVEDLMSGIDIRRMGTVRGKSLVKNISQDLKAWRYRIRRKYVFEFIIVVCFIRILKCVNF